MTLCTTHATWHEAVRSYRKRWATECATLTARGVRYHLTHVRRFVRALGPSVQNPIERTTQRDEAAIERWYRKR